MSSGKEPWHPGEHQQGRQSPAGGGPGGHHRFPSSGGQTVLPPPSSISGSGGGYYGSSNQQPAAQTQQPQHQLPHMSSLSGNQSSQIPPYSLHAMQPGSMPLQQRPHSPGPSAQQSHPQAQNLQQLPPPPSSQSQQPPSQSQQQQQQQQQQPPPASQVGHPERAPAEMRPQHGPHGQLPSPPPMTHSSQHSHIYGPGPQSGAPPPQQPQTQQVQQTQATSQQQNAHGDRMPPANPPNAPSQGAQGNPSPQQQQQLQQQQQQQANQQAVAASLLPAEAAATSLLTSHGGNPAMAGPGIAAGLPASYRPLNVKDALSYLDQVKVQFSEQPDVYNKFLDIMKDFKSQAIDTPGVIERVSTLFSGHPNLIQGFNTFLPPGYRIECSTDPSDPLAIRVTTPQGTTTASTGGGNITSITQAHLHHQAQAGGQGPAPPQVAGLQWRNGVGNWNNTNDNAAAAAAAAAAGYRYDGIERPPGPPGQQSAQQQQQPPQGQQAQAQALQQQQAQQGQVSTGPGRPGVPNATNMPSPAAGQMGAGAPPPPILPPGAPGTPGVDVRRGPVEFNHAISYVNKIKTRFQNQPEIYKQFLEILQTYQKESKPIQEVYSQVTQLFNAAPDLLEDFKQFLPESAAQARAAVAAQRSLAEDPNMDPQGVLGQVFPPRPSLVEDRPGGGASAGQNGAAGRLPPVGNFAPPPTGNKEKRKRQNTGQNVAQSATALAQQAQAMHGINEPVPGGSVQRGHAAKRPKTQHKPAVDAPVSPTLVPAQPEPLIPTTTTKATQDEIQMFDRTKKYFNNKQTYHEFLKLINLFTQDILNVDILLDRLEHFLGANLDLFNWFSTFIGRTSAPTDNNKSAVQNQPAGGQKVKLATCRALGPSYRLLPKMETTKACSGRDEMCWEVLNDQWASHPTWASEDSGFVGHKKNQFEEMLHRVEEERHDYDHNIEACLRAIQLLEPIEQRIAAMTPDERACFKLEAGLGGQSRTIYQRVIKKIWDRESGAEIIHALHENPCQAVPVVLRRLKQKEEEWRIAYREWNKVWREQTSKIHDKSLDHAGISVKGNDKRLVNPRSFVGEIQARHLEQANKDRGGNPAAEKADYHLKYSFTDPTVLIDVARLLTAQSEKENAYSTHDRNRITSFLLSFFPLFFDISREDLANMVNSMSSRNADDEDDQTPTENGTPSRSRRTRHDTDLLRDVLRRSGRSGKSRSNKEGSVSGSRGSSPEPGSNDDEVMDDMPVPTSAASPRVSPDVWIAQANGPRRVEDSPGPLSSLAKDAKDVYPSELKARSTYNLFGNSSIYVFFRYLEILYSRLLEVKKCEPEVRGILERRSQEKAAHSLGISQNNADDFFVATPDGNYYQQVLEHCERLIQGNLDSSAFEEGMRSVFVMKGWMLYTIDKHCASINKMIVGFGSETKDQTGEILKLFEADRMEKKSNYHRQMHYRKQVDALVAGKEDSVFRLEWNEDMKEVKVQLLTKSDPTTSVKLTKDEKWSYYIDSFLMTAPTENIPLNYVMPFIKRNIPPPDEDTITPDMSRPRIDNADWDLDRPIIKEELALKVSVNNYHAFFSAGTQDKFIMSHKYRAETQEQVDRAAARRRTLFREKFEVSPSWPSWPKSPEELQEATEAFKKSLLPENVNANNDVEMTDS